jgi:ribosomal protein L20
MGGNMRKPRLCKWCGKYYIPEANGQLYCKPDCYDKSYEYRHQPKKKKKNNAEEIAEINSAAMKAGMSYGKYVAMQYMKEGK